MSIQKPVAWCREPDKYGRRKLSFEKPTGITASVAEKAVLCLWGKKETWRICL